MIAALFATLALADDPVATPESVDAVGAVTWAQPFTLENAAPYGMRGDRPSFERGWILQLAVRPGMGRARAIDQPVLYVGPWPARVVNPSEDGGCLVVWAPASDDSDPRVWFGSRLLPERVDADRARAELDAAIAAGAPVLTPAERAPALRASRVDDVWTAANQAVARCTPTP